MERGKGKKGKGKGRKRGRKEKELSVVRLTNPLPLTGEAERPSRKGATFGGVRPKSHRHDLAGRSTLSFSFLSAK